jgi:hypothetical protein
LADDLHLRVVTDSDARGLQQAEKELAATRKEAGKLDDIFVSAGKSSDKLEESLHEQTAEIKKLQAEYARTKKSVSDLTVEWLDADRENDQIVRRELRRERSRLAELQRAAKEFESTFKIKFGNDLTTFTRAGENAGNAFINAFGDVFSGGLGAIKMPALVGAIGGLATAVLPGLGALIGGGITGALGTGAMAAGILSAIHNAEVKSAAKQFGDDLMGEFFSGGATFAGPIVAGLDILRQGVRDLGIADLLAPLAPTVITIAHGIADFVNNLKDNGLSATLGRMEGFAHIAAEGLASAGDALGFFFDQVSKDKGSMDGLRAFFAILNGTVRIAAVGINFLEEVFHRFSVTLAGVATFANKLSFGHLDQFQRAAENILGTTTEVSGQMVFLADSTHEVKRRLDEQADAMQRLGEEAESTRRALDDFLGNQLSAAEANLAVEQGYFRLKEAIAENGRTLDVHTEKGLANRQAILDQIGVLERQRQATIEATGDMKGANDEFDRGLDRLKRMATAAGITGEALDSLVGDYYLRVHLDVIANAAQQIFNQLGQLVNNVFGHRAAGGKVRAGEGYIVGERQAELFVPESDGYVFPEVRNGGPGGAVGGGNARPVIINLPPGASDEDQRLIERLRTVIAARGGTLAVLGLRN